MSEEKSNPFFPTSPEEKKRLALQLLSGLGFDAKKQDGPTNALSGGSMPKVLGGDGGLPSLDTDWSKWFVFFSDERCVDWTHEDSNYTDLAAGLKGGVVGAAGAKAGKDGKKSKKNRKRNKKKKKRKE